ncbi:MAG TPA: glycosyltransferase family 39 protein [Vicinamibacteria bacterium]|nr:glycosyltransferase family 39 protein [Vicinamibacteria bacterium]
MRTRGALLLVLAAALVLGAWGLRWGLPSEFGWAPDEVLPAEVDAAVAQRFAHGWHGKYPPLHFALLAAASAPARLAGHVAGWDAARVHDARMTSGRVLSLALSLGVLLVVYRCGRETGDARAGVLAAALLALSVPFPYYAKTANLDVPYLFWFALSVLFFLRALRRGRAADFGFFALAAAAAVATKDQAFALYVLTVPFLVWEIVRRRRAEGPNSSVWADRRLALLLVGGAIAFAVLGGALFNPGGWIAHVRLIAGPASTAFRMFDQGLSGHIALLAQTARHLAFVMGGPSLLAALAGLVFAWQDRAHQRALLATLVPAVSYVAFFPLVVLYVYDRFLLPVALVLALFGGLALARATRARSWAAKAAVAGVLALSLARAASVDILMARDSRYAVEDWLRREVGPGPLVAAVGPLEYLPRLDGLHWRRLGPAAVRLAQVSPDVVVVNADYARRADEGTGERAFYSALDDGSLGYEVALRRRTRPRVALDTDALRMDGPGRIWSNLDKVDPEIVVYRRR